MDCVDLECGGGLGSSAVTNDEEECVCLSEAKEGSCDSTSYSTAKNSIHGSNLDSEPESDQVLDTNRVWSVVGSDCVIDIDRGVSEHANFPGTEDRDCRICNLSLRDEESGIAFELGCSCKDDLAAVHQHCADTWFKIKGNNICEICHSIAQNVVIPDDINSSRQNGGAVTSETIDIEAGQQISAVYTFTSNAVAVQGSSNPEILGFVEAFCLIVAVIVVLVLVIYA